MSLSNLKKNSAAALEKFKQQVENSNKSSSNRVQDPDLWRPTFDAEKGSGSAVIRFLPAVEGEDLPWVKLIRHAFKNKTTGKWYIENSRRTINEDDPVAQLNGRLWNSGVESDREICKAQKQKIEYTTNVLVIRDPANPENEGTVKKYRFGPMIFEMIQNAMFPKFEGEEAIDPFNPWFGANFNIRILGKIVGNDVVPNYEKSSFSAPSPLFDGDDAKIEAVYAQCKPLANIVALSNFKSYEDLAKNLISVVGSTAGSGVPTVEGYAIGKPEVQEKKDLFDDGDRPEKETPKEDDKPKAEAVDTSGEDYLRSLLEDC